MLKKIIPFLFLVLILTFTRNAFAHQDNSQVNQAINYQFPYPGILPDHSLYPLKVLRDKIYDFFIADDLKKAEFKLLIADKRFYMGVMLMEKGKINLAEKTVSKASKYYEEGVLILYKMQQEEKDIDIIKHKFVDASRMYEDIISKWQEGSTQDIKTGLQTSLELFIKYQKELLAI